MDRTNPSAQDSLYRPDLWSGLTLAEHRDLLAAELMVALGDSGAVAEAVIELGPPDRPYDLTAAIRTEVGTLRAPLWSHVRATLFCDESIHPENRKRFAPGIALREAADDLLRRLAVPFRLESRGLEISYEPAEGVERSWSAEKSVFRGRTAVIREDRIAPGGDADLPTLLARHYAGPSLRAIGADGSAFFLPGARELPDGPLVSLCWGCSRWQEGAELACSGCGGPVEVVVATRPPLR